MGRFECVENTKKILISIFQWSRSQFRVVNVYKRVPVKYRNDAPLTWSDIGQSTHINKIIQLEIYIGTICTPGEKNKLKKKNLPLLCCVGLVNFWLVLSRDQLTWLPREDSSSEVAPYQLFLQPQAILLPYANISNGLKHNVGQKSWTKRSYIFASCQPSWCSCPAGWPYDIFSGPGALWPCV